MEYRNTALPSWLPDSPVLEKYLNMVKIDFARSTVIPGNLRIIVASVCSIVFSLLADIACVAIGEKIFPSTVGFVHFRFSDYATLTILGIIAACVGWYILLQISSSPKWVFLRSAAVITLVLYLPDLWIWLKGEPIKAVSVLMVMHLVIALVTYNCMVHLAPVRVAPKSRVNKVQARSSF